MPRKIIQMPQHGDRHYDEHTLPILISLTAGRISNYSTTMARIPGWWATTILSINSRLSRRSSLKRGKLSRQSTRIESKPKRTLGPSSSRSIRPGELEWGGFSRWK
jgi:hypothetical protein